MKVLFCAENPIRRAGLAQALLACAKIEDKEKGLNVPAPAPQEQVAPKKNKLRILLCEDNIVNVEVITSAPSFCGLMSVLGYYKAAQAAWLYLRYQKQWRGWS